MSTDSTIRDGAIFQATEAARARDTLILQKVNQAHRAAFRQRFPGQVEHILRLTAERLQAVLTAKPTDLADPNTWIATAQEIRDLSEALYYLAQINKENPVQGEPGVQSNA
jgi:hypothetical protein